MKKQNAPLFELDETWKQEWVGMPEFVQDDLTSFRKIVIHFRSAEDVQKFAELIGQHITPKQKALWFPQYEIRRYGNKRYVDESELSNLHHIKGKME